MFMEHTWATGDVPEVIKREVRHAPSLPVTCYSNAGEDKQETNTLTTDCGQCRGSERGAQKGETLRSGQEGRRPAASTRSSTSHVSATGKNLAGPGTGQASVPGTQGWTVRHAMGPGGGQEPRRVGA